VNDGKAQSSTNAIVRISEESQERPTNENMLNNFIWLLIILIILILSLYLFNSSKRYLGNYKIEEIYWIYNNGTLIYHKLPRKTLVDLKNNKHIDDDIFSGMLTGIIMFIQQVFSDDKEENENDHAWSIEEIKMDNKNVMVIKGNLTYLAIIFSGKSGKILNKRSSKTLRKVEDHYQPILTNWNGDVGKLKNVSNFLNKVM
jgi:hypothetical protein